MYGYLAYQSPRAARGLVSLCRMPPPRLFAEAKPGYEPLIPRRLCPAEVTQQPTPLSHKLHQAALGMVILAMHPQMLRYLADALRQQRYLHICRTRVRGVQVILLYQLFPSRFGEHPLRGQPQALSYSFHAEYSTPSLAAAMRRRYTGWGSVRPPIIIWVIRMAKVAIVTDSSSCLPAELIEQHRITVVPLAFLFDGQLHYDGTLSSRDFYDRLRASRRSPTTTSPAPGEFLEAFRHTHRSGAQALLCLTLPPSYSGTYGSAVNARELAAQELPGLPVRVLDTHGLAMSHGFAVLAAARAVEAGADLEEAAAAAETVGSRAHLVGALDTMRYLAKSGRIPWIVHWAASVLQIKPILAADAETVGGVGRARTMPRALEHLLHYLEERLEQGAPLHVAVMHADAPDRAQDLAERVQRRFSPTELIVTEFTSVMGVHTGPGFLGLAFYSEAEVPQATGEAADPPALEEDVRTLEASLGPLPQPQATSALVVVSGLPGSGKSHFTRALCQRYPMAPLDSDALRKALFTRPTHSADESARLFAACHALLDRLLARGIPAVLDATSLREIHRRPLYDIADKRKAKLLLVEVQAPPELVKQRLEARQRGENPWDHSQAGAEVYERMRRQAEPIQRRHLVVDTSQEIGPALDRLVRELQGVGV